MVSSSKRQQMGNITTSKENMRVETRKRQKSHPDLQTAACPGVACPDEPRAQSGAQSQETETSATGETLPHMRGGRVKQADRKTQDSDSEGDYPDLVPSSHGDTHPDNLMESEEESDSDESSIDISTFWRNLNVGKGTPTGGENSVAEAEENRASDNCETTKASRQPQWQRELAPAGQQAPLQQQQQPQLQQQRATTTPIIHAWQGQQQQQAYAPQFHTIANGLP